MPNPLSPSYNQVMERLSYITPDGQELRFVSPWYVIQEDGFGMPPLEYITQRGPFQHGETVKEVWLRPRTIQILVRREACNRPDYATLRDSLVNYMRPNRLPTITPGILRKYRANGTVREWFVYLTEGPSFPSHEPDKWDQWAIQDTIRFTAYDPVARDPTPHTQTYAATGGTASTFPITFPISFASFGSSDPLNYVGTWGTFPTIVINGPATGTLIRNLTTDEELNLSYAIPSGRVVTITLDYGNKRVLLDDGTNLIGYLTPSSDIGSFHLQPGVNDMQIYASGTSTITSVILSWYDRYIA